MYFQALNVLQCLNMPRQCSVLEDWRGLELVEFSVGTMNLANAQAVPVQEYMESFQLVMKC